MPRILNTAKLVLAVGQPNNFTPHGNAINTIAKVRLSHAFVRNSLLNNPDEKWDPNLHNIPINQRDMAGTLVCFMGLVPDGLERFGVNFEPKEIEGYIHLWNITGQLIGIRSDLLVDDYEDCLGFARYFFRELSKQSQVGMDLQKALIEYLRIETPGKLGHGIHETMMRYLLGDKICDMLNIRKSDWTRIFIPVVKMVMKDVDELGDRSEFFARESSFVFRNMLRMALYVLRQGKRVDFELAEKTEKQFHMI